MSQNVVTNSEFSAKNFSLADPKKKDGRINALGLYNGRPFYSETPLSSTPFGITTFQGGEKQDYSMNMSLNKEDPYTQQLNQLDEYMIDYGVKHSKVIFGKEYTPAQRPIVEALYSRVLKEGRKDGDKEYPPRIAPKIMRSRDATEKPNLMFFHSSSEEVELDSFDQLVSLVPKGSKVKSLIVFRPWFISGKFGLSCNVIQVLAPKRSFSRPTGYAFNSSEDLPAEDSPASNQAQAGSDKDAEEEDKEYAQDSDVTDSDEAEEEEAEDDDVEEDEEEEEEEEEPTPPPSPPKKTAKKATTSRKRASAKS